MFLWSVVCIRVCVCSSWWFWVVGGGCVWGVYSERWEDGGDGHRVGRRRRQVCIGGSRDRQLDPAPDPDVAGDTAADGGLGGPRGGLCRGELETGARGVVDSKGGTEDCHAARTRGGVVGALNACLLSTSPSPRDS